MILYARVKALTQEKLAFRAAEVASEIESRGGTIVSISLYIKPQFFIFSWLFFDWNKYGVVFYKSNISTSASDA